MRIFKQTNIRVCVCVCVWYRDGINNILANKQIDKQKQSF